MAVMRRLGHAVVFLDGDSVPVSNNASDPSKTYESTYGLLPISGRLQITVSRTPPECSFPPLVGAACGDFKCCTAAKSLQPSWRRISMYKSYCLSLAKV